MGALSPRTRNAQVALFQAGEVDYLVATDAIGMGLNMDVDHVAFAGLDKFDGRERAPAAPRRDGADRRPRRAPHERRHASAPRPRWAASTPGRSRRSRTTASGRSSSCAGATPSSTSPRSRTCSRASSASRPRPACCAPRNALDHAASSCSPAARRCAIAPATAGRRAPALGGLPAPRLPQDADRCASRTCWRPSSAISPTAAALPADWVAAQVARLDRVDGDIDALIARLAAHPHLDLYRPPRRLARRRAALAGAHARGRGRAVRRAARAPDPALRRPAHPGAAQGPARRRPAGRRSTTTARSWSTARRSGGSRACATRSSRARRRRRAARAERGREAGARRPSCAAGRKRCSQPPTRPSRLDDQGRIVWRRGSAAPRGRSASCGRVRRRWCRAWSCWSRTACTARRAARSASGSAQWLDGHLAELTHAAAAPAGGRAGRRPAAASPSCWSRAWATCARGRAQPLLKALGADDRAHLTRLGVRFGVRHIYLAAMLQPRVTGLRTQAVGDPAPHGGARARRRARRFPAAAALPPRTLPRRSGTRCSPTSACASTWSSVWPRACARWPAPRRSSWSWSCCA